MNVIASPTTIFAVDSVGRLLSVDIETGQVVAQAAIWPYGPLGTVQGASIALTDGVVAVAATDTYFLPQTRLPYLRGKLVLFNAEDLTRLWELPGLSGHAYQILAQRGQIAVTTDGETVAVYQARTGQLLWHRTMPGTRFRLLAASRDTLFVHSTRVAPPEQRGPYERRQTFLALDWATGQTLWEQRPMLENEVFEAMTDGTRLYLRAFQGRIVALDAATGEELWRISDEAAMLSDEGPMAVAYGKIYALQAPEPAVVAYDAATGELAWRTPLPNTRSVPALAIAGDYLYLTEQQEDRSQLRILDARTGQPVLQTETARNRSVRITAYPGLAVAADRLILAGNDLRAFGAAPEVADPPPVPAPTFIAYTPPADEVLYELVQTNQGDIWGRPANQATPPRNITAHDANDWDPAGAPDGQRIAFESYRSGTSNIWVVDRDGQHPIAVTHTDQNNIYNLHPSWSPNGEFIAFASNRTGKFQIWLARADGSEVYPLTSEGANWDPAWSPDGTLIAFISDRSGNPDIWVMSADGSNQRPWRESPEPEANPAWSPGCATDLNGPTCALAFVRLTDEQSQWGELRARLFNGSLEWTIPGGFWGHDRGPAWWPGCRALGSQCWLVWSRQLEDSLQLILGDLDGSRVQALGEGKDPSWLVQPSE